MDGTSMDPEPGSSKMEMKNAVDGRKIVYRIFTWDVIIGKRCIIIMVQVGCRNAKGRSDETGLSLVRGI